MTESQKRYDPPTAADDCAEVTRQRFATGMAPSDGQSAMRGSFRIQRADYGSELYKALLNLRHRVLRAPLGLSLWDENLTLESQQWHFALVDQSGRPLACLTAVPLQNGRVKLRQMAVEPDYQGLGMGRALLQGVENVLREQGVQSIELHARQSALAFYERQGYKACGDIFTEVTVPHLKMTRQLV